MIPVDQTKFIAPYANGFAACVASIFELPIEEVPDFRPDEDGWWLRFSEWCNERGWAPLMLDNDVGYLGGCWSLIGGDGPRGLLHQCVGRRGEVVHDPHPSRDGLKCVLNFIYFVAIDLARFDDLEVPLGRIGDGRYG